MNTALRQIITSVKPEIPSWLRSSLVGYWSGGHRDNVYYELTNLISNGNFANGTTGWTNVDAVVDGIAEATAAGSGVNDAAYQSKESTTSQKIYARVLLKADSANVKLFIYDGWTMAVTAHSGANAFETLSVLKTTNASGVSFVRVGIIDARVSDYTKAYFYNVICINLTAIFGTGNEPTAAEMDAILAADGTAYWDGTRNVLCNPNSKYFWYDYSGNGRHSKANNMAWTTASGWDGYLLVHDGTDDYMRRTLSAAIADGSSYGYSLTVKSVANKAIANLHTTTTVAMIIGLDASGYAYVTVYDTAANAYTVTDNSSKAGILTRITAVVDIANTKLYLYVNGVSRGTPATLANTIRGFITASVGTNAATNAYTALSVGMGMQVGRALTATEEAQLYNANKRRFNI